MRVVGVVVLLFLREMGQRKKGREREGDGGSSVTSQSILIPTVSVNQSNRIKAQASIDCNLSRLNPVNYQSYP